MTAPTSETESQNASDCDDDSTEEEEEAREGRRGTRNAGTEGEKPPGQEAGNNSSQEEETRVRHARLKRMMLGGAVASTLDDGGDVSDAGEIDATKRARGMIADGALSELLPVEGVDVSVLRPTLQRIRGMLLPRACVSHGVMMMNVHESGCARQELKQDRFQIFSQSCLALLVVSGFILTGALLAEVRPVLAAGWWTYSTLTSYLTGFHRLLLG